LINVELLTNTTWTSGIVTIKNDPKTCKTNKQEIDNNDLDRK
jgi:hypothetical protein